MKSSGVNRGGLRSQTPPPEKNPVCATDEKKIKNLFY